MKHQNGFSLLELMVTVAIVGILSSIAIPAYTSYIIRGKLVEASSTLADGRIKFEQYFQDSRQYTNAANATTANPAGVCPPATKYFTYACVADATTYTITAANKAGLGLGAVSDYTYTINQSNAKATTKFAGAANASACWLMKAGDSC